jgi:hypothetical protein
MHEITKAIEALVSERDHNRNLAQFMAKWVDAKYRDGGRITARDYQEFMAEMPQIKHTNL